MKRNGFTLVELCFVTLILGLTATLGFPRLDITLRHQSLSHINAQLFSFIKNVQRYAILSDKNMTLCIHKSEFNKGWWLFSTQDSSCDLASAIKQTSFSPMYELQAKRYTREEKKAISQPSITTFYASTGRSSTNYRLVFEDHHLNQHIGLRITNIGAIKLCASDTALSVFQKGREEVLACQ